MKEDQKFESDIVQGYTKPTIWCKFTELAEKTNSVNLGQGMPDWQPPKFFMDNMQKQFSNTAFYQYTRNVGSIKLCEAVSRNYEKYFKRKIDPMTEVVIGAGGVNVLYIAMMALVKRGDEVVMIEPFYHDCCPQIQFCGGKVVGVPMIPPKSRPKSEFEKITKDVKDVWTIDFESLEKAFTKKTKVLYLNTPNNPTGKILTYEELHKIAKILEKFPRVVVLVDEVYEYQIGDCQELPRMSTVKGMWEKCISVMSAGKIFNATGIRIGWAIGPNSLIRQLNPVFQYSSYCIAEPMQNAVAESLDMANESCEGFESYYKWTANHYKSLRNHFLENMAKVKTFDINLLCPESGFFTLGDISKLKSESKYILPGDENEKNLSYPKDYKILLNICNQYKVVGMPCSPFYSKEHKNIGENFIRFAFSKQTSTLDKAIHNFSNPVKDEEEEEDDDDDDDKKGNKSEKKVRKALGKLGMTKINGVNRVTVKPKDNNILIIKDAEVFSSKDVENTFIIFGELTFDEPDKKAAKEELQKFTKEGETLQKQGETKTEKPIENVVIEEEDPNAEVNTDGLDQSAIDTVMEEGNCSKAKAVKILRSTDGDVVAALLKLTDN